ncbi:hypothetical protein [Alteromonas lipotrueiana]|uniref:hypothetical protein n=1 Tax=Alteromonas lipotrueiana TaxID=2803815 RepID=UPI001C49123D|nr:hypothetical protein [Alteromonas lipotrueiana]|tara:strand:- start:260 stop:457 length:198 start_codon:yes stop_codon:yes gene_type:complete
MINITPALGLTIAAALNLLNSGWIWLTDTGSDSHLDSLQTGLLFLILAKTYQLASDTATSKHHKK